MSYLVLARKYRPRTFTEMVGQEHVVQALTNALTSQRLHHAYLFTGTRGVGKTTVSRVLAKSLNCVGLDGQGGITATPCGVCQACSDIDSGRFVDYTELDAASNRGVDEVQSLLEQAVYKPVQGRYKVFMIDEVHMLTNTAFNAMLKTLEEPPEYLKFVLATTDPQKVPVTVLSRCLQFNLRPMAPQTVLEHLQGVLKAEGVAAEAAALKLLARAARGSMRDALSLTDQAIAYGSGAVMEASVRQMLGSVDRGYVMRLILALAHSDGRTVVETVEELRLHGLSAAATLEEMSTVLQRMAVLQAAPTAASATDELDPDAQTIEQLAAELPRDETQLLYSICLHGRGELGLAPDEYAALTMVLLRLLAFKPAGSARPAELTEKKSLNIPEVARPVAPSVTSVTRHEPNRTGVEPRSVASPAVIAPKTVESEKPSEPFAVKTPAARAEVDLPPGQVLPVREARFAPEPGKARDEPHASALGEDSGIVAVPVRHLPEEPLPPASSDSSVIATTEEGDFWHTLVSQLVAAEVIGALVRELALQSQLVARDTDHWMLRVERESLNQAGARERLRQALAGAGHDVTLSVEVGKVVDSPARRNAVLAARKLKEAEEIILGDPFVQAMMRDYGAKIVPGSLKPI